LGKSRNLTTGLGGFGLVKRTPFGADAGLSPSALATTRASVLSPSLSSTSRSVTRQRPLTRSSSSTASRSSRKRVPFTRASRGGSQLDCCFIRVALTDRAHGPDPGHRRLIHEPARRLPRRAVLRARLVTEDLLAFLQGDFVLEVELLRLARLEGGQRSTLAFH